MDVHPTKNGIIIGIDPSPHRSVQIEGMMNFIWLSPWGPALGGFDEFSVSRRFPPFVAEL